MDLDITKINIGGFIDAPLDITKNNFDAPLVN